MDALDRKSKLFVKFAKAIKSEDGVVYIKGMDRSKYSNLGQSLRNVLFEVFAPIDPLKFEELTTQQGLKDRNKVKSLFYGLLIIKKTSYVF